MPLIYFGHAGLVHFLRLASSVAVIPPSIAFARCKVCPTGASSASGRVGFRLRSDPAVDDTFDTGVRFDLPMRVLLLQVTWYTCAYLVRGFPLGLSSLVHLC